MELLALIFLVAIIFSYIFMRKKEFSNVQDKLSQSRAGRKHIVRQEYLDKIKEENEARLRQEQEQQEYKEKIKKSPLGRFDR